MLQSDATREQLVTKLQNFDPRSSNKDDDPLSKFPYNANMKTLSIGIQVISMQRAFMNRYGKEAPSNKSILRWYHQFKETDCLCKKKSSGRPSVSEEAIKKVRQSFVRSVYTGEGRWFCNGTDRDRGKVFYLGAYGRGKRKSLVLEAEALSCFRPERMEFLQAVYRQEYVLPHVAQKEHDNFSSKSARSLDMPPMDHIFHYIGWQFSHIAQWVDSTSELKY
ncbi:hypothetical protein TNCV_4584071 [Trichonephila clavipes]|nr:hypothetical protein TNCV_4584071 [Trichonephila clavipes]